MTQPTPARAAHARAVCCLLAAWGVGFGASATAQTRATAAVPPPSTPHSADAQLHCEVGYAGATQIVKTQPVSDPYPVESVDIGGRFRFKAVMVGSGQRVAYIKLYSYFETPQQPVLIHLAKYLPPFTIRSTTAPAKRDPRGTHLTGMQYLYAGPLEHELQYQCFLQGAQP